MNALELQLLLDLAPIALGFVRAGLRTLLSNRRKDLHVTDLPVAAQAVAAPIEITGAAPIATAPAVAAPAVDGAAVVSSVVQSVTSHPDVASSAAASVITDILAGLYQAQPAIFAVSRASAKTQAEVSLGLGLAEILVGALLKRRG